MRHTLLPPPERKVLRREYRVRAGIVLCFMVSLAGLVGVGALFPSFYHATVDERTGISQISSLKQGKDASGITQIEKELIVDNTLLNIVSTSGDATNMSTVIAAIVGARGNISLVSLSMTRIATTSVGVAIQGIAPTREALLSFKSRLEQLSPGNAVNLPISELAKSTDVHFALQLGYSIP